MTEWFEKFVFDKKNKQVLTLAVTIFFLICIKYVFICQIQVQGIVQGGNQTTVPKEDTKTCTHEEMCLKFLDSHDIKRDISLVKDIAGFKRSLYYYPTHKVIN